MRGGAIGDFVLTLPTIATLRKTWPQAHLEILGYPQIAALALGVCADAVRSIEDAQLVALFVPETTPPPELASYFASFDLIVSYLHDPGDVVRQNLARCGTGRLLIGPSRVGQRAHAAYELAEPLRELGLPLDDPAPRIVPGEAELAEAARRTGSGGKLLVALHPGSGSTQKTWPLERWERLQAELKDLRIVLLGGEADERAVQFLGESWTELDLVVLMHEPLPLVAAVLAQCAFFLGHDSGISHIAGAVGTRSLLLFGPTDPSRWAPPHDHVQVLRAPDETMDALALDEVRAALRYELMRIGIRT